MRKRAYSHDYFGSGWPDLSYLEPFFMRKGTKCFDDGGNDSATPSLHGVDGTDLLPAGTGRVDVVLYLTGNPDCGGQLFYKKGISENFFSQGDLRKIDEFVYSLHGTLLTLGLFIPFDRAWEAVKEFMQTEGRLPTSIEWVRGDDLPDNIFPDP